MRTTRLEFLGLKQLLNSDARAAGRLAASAFADANPEFRVHNASLRADEDSRYVFAVFYSNPDRLVKPGPYAIVAVDRVTNATEVLDLTPDSPYWIRGRK